MKDDMNAETPAEESLQKTLAELHAEIARLSDRVAALESGMAHAPNSQSPADVISAETIAAISAAIAALLGVTPRIRQIRLVGRSSWAQQGRVTIQASHALVNWHD